MEIGSMAICITLGALICFVLFGVGVCFGRDYKRKSNDDSDMRIYVPDRDRDRRGNNGCYKQVEAEEVVDRLQNLRLALSAQEKIDLDYACDCVMRIKRLQEYIKSRRNSTES